MIHTGQGFESRRDESGWADADAHFTKPMSPQRLLRRLEALGVQPRIGAPVD
jgi:hypothetical protein